MKAAGALRQAEQAWEAIAHSLFLKYPESPSQVGQIAQRVVLVTLCLAICEGLEVVAPGQLKAIAQHSNPYIHLAQCWQRLKGLNSFSLDPARFNPVFEDGLLGDVFSGFAQFITCGSKIPVELLGQVYEMLLAKAICPAESSVGRFEGQKRTGAYYTPEAIAHYIVHNTVGQVLSRPPNQQESLRILDPTCGGGIFLLTAYQMLLNWQLQQYEWQLTQAERTRILLDHIYGVDLDAQAVEVTRLSLLLKLLETVPNPDLSQLPDLSQNIQSGNAIVETFSETSGSQQFEPLPLNWHTAFPQAMRSGGFEVVIGNPPYIDSETMTRSSPDCRHYCTTHYQSAVGNWDIFCVFMEKALQLCKWGGLQSFVVPNKLLSADYAVEARSLLHHHQLISIRDYSRVSAFAVAVYPLVYVVKKELPSSGSTVQYELMQTVEKVARSHTYTPTSSLDFADQSDVTSPWLIAIQPQQADLIARLRQRFTPLGAIAEVTGAATVAEAYAIQSLIRENQAPEASDLRLVNSGTLDRYSTLWGKKRLRYLGASYLHPVVPAHLRLCLPYKREQQAIASKILVAGMTRNLECALDSTGTVLAGKSTSVVRSVIDLRYLLGLLNSKLINFYFVNSFASNSLQGGYLRIGPSQLQQIPICWMNEWMNGERGREGDRHHQIIHLVDQMLSDLQHQCTTEEEQQRLQAQINSVDQQIDQLVCELYQLTDTETEMVLSTQSNQKEVKL